MYLSQDAIKNSLANFARCCPGSITAFDYFSKEFISTLFQQKLTKHIGEKFFFGGDVASLQSLAETSGLRIVESLKSTEIAARYAPCRANGDYTTGVNSEWEGFLALKVV